MERDDHRARNLVQDFARSEGDAVPSSVRSTEEAHARISHVPWPWTMLLAATPTQQSYSPLQPPGQIVNHATGDHPVDHGYSAFPPSVTTNAGGNHPPSLHGWPGSKMRVFLGVINAEAFVQEPHILNVLVLQLVAGMGAHMHGSREALHWRARNHTLPCQGIGRKGQTAVPRRRSTAVLVDVQHVYVNLTPKCILQHKSSGDLVARLVSANQKYRLFVVKPPVLAPDLFQDEAAPTERRGHRWEIVERDKGVQILVGTGLPFEERVDAPPSIDPDLNAMFLECGIEFKHILGLHRDSPSLRVFTPTWWQGTASGCRPTSAAARRSAAAGG